MLGFQREI